MSIRYPIVKPVLPNIDAYQSNVNAAFERNWLTNGGLLLQKLESALAQELGVEHLVLVANGTLALQVAYRALGIDGKVLTSPFTFAATASSLLWQSIDVDFVDVDAATFNTDVRALERSLEQSPNEYSAFVGVHVFGNPSEVEQIETLADKHHLKVVYDAAHAFGVRYNGRSLLSFGDAATLSLHATKVFHCIEGGAIVFKHKADADKARALINFGFNAAGFPAEVGINAKMSEMHASMGVCLLDNIDNILCHRASLYSLYCDRLAGIVEFQDWQQGASQNGAYMPVLLRDEREVVNAIAKLLEQGVQTRRYFYPSLSKVSCYQSHSSTPVSDCLSLRVLCLPMYYDLQMSDVEQICQIVKDTLSGIRKVGA